MHNCYTVHTTVGLDLSPQAPLFEHTTPYKILP